MNNGRGVDRSQRGQHLHNITQDEYYHLGNLVQYGDLASNITSVGCVWLRNEKYHVHSFKVCQRAGSGAL